jgi:hypothetical protein
MGNEIIIIIRKRARIELFFVTSASSGLEQLPTICHGHTEEAAARNEQEENANTEFSTSTRELDEIAWEITKAFPTARFESEANSTARGSRPSGFVSKSL